jgi:hypothetical protein
LIINHPTESRREWILAMMKKTGKENCDTASLNIAQYAYKANISIPNFKRRFSEQTGFHQNYIFAWQDLIMQSL